MNHKEVIKVKKSLLNELYNDSGRNQHKENLLQNKDRGNGSIVAVGYSRTKEDDFCLEVRVQNKRVATSKRKDC